MKKSPSILHQWLLPCVLVVNLAAAPPVFAHGGEDHSETDTSAHTTQVLAPRAEAKSDEVELLALYQDNHDNQEKTLTLYLSHFNTNAPIDNAEVDIESGMHKATAIPDGNGRYSAATPWLATPGKHALVVTIQGKDVADLLETSLDIPAAATAPPAGLAARLGAGAVGVWAAVVALGSAGVLAWFYVWSHRRKQSKKTMRVPS